MSVDLHTAREKQFAMRDTTIDQLCGQEITTLGKVAYVTQSDLGFHPDTVLSASDYPNVHARHMSASVVRGTNFIAVRLAPTDNHELTHAKVEFVYVRVTGNGAHLAKLGKAMSNDEQSTFFSLARGEAVDGWKRI